MSKVIFRSYQNLLILLLLLFYSSCTVINVYVPGYQAGNTTEKSSLQNNFFAIEDKQQNEYFAQIDPFLFGIFYKQKYSNLPGNTKQLLAYELKRNQQKYNLLPRKGQKLLLQINEFQLQAVDHCSKNISSVKLHIQTFIVGETQPLLDFTFEDHIDSLTSDCYTLASSLPLFLGWIWYMPYLGFRGDREDQLNTLGRLALLKYFEKLDAVLNRKEKENE